jgi:hypothetical protein
MNECSFGEIYNNISNTKAKCESRDKLFHGQNFVLLLLMMYTLILNEMLTHTSFNL